MKALDVEGLGPRGEKCILIKANEGQATQGKLTDGVRCPGRPPRTNRVAMDVERSPNIRHDPRNPGKLGLDPDAIKGKPKNRWILFVVFFVIAAGPAHATNVLTYHYNNQRTGWNAAETVLTPSNVSGLQLEATVALDDQVDSAQPLVFDGAVYVVTENDSVYAIDAASGTVITKTSLGKPVSTPIYGCNPGHIGITSTPVIDPASQTLYVMAYTYNSRGTPIFQLHALDTKTLADKVPPRTVAASRTLTSGKAYDFYAPVQRQRPALLLSVNGNIYAGFGSFCDTYKNYYARGWLLGWKGGSLAPVGAYLTDQDATDTNDFFLTSIWMSGSGIAEDYSANLYFATANSDTGSPPQPPGSAYDAHNLSQSVIEMSPDLTTVESFFTPVGNVALNEDDLDMASGGVVLTGGDDLVAAGKAGEMFLLRQGHLGGHATGNYLAEADIGTCLCTESYYRAPDNTERIVSSGGNQEIEVWLEPSLKLESASPKLNGSVGFFTSVSSNGLNNTIIWAVDRPEDVYSSQAAVTLWAYDPVTAKVLFSQAAGTWLYSAAENSNNVPVVANGHVYVASYKQLTIWGLTAPSSVVKLAHPAFEDPVQLQPGEHDVFGTITAIEGNTITVKKRDGSTISVNTANAAGVRLTLNEPVRVVGKGTKTGLDAKWVARAQGKPTVWLRDR
jgi:PQQ-like domain